jgi:hypothetical protein
VDALPRARSRPRDRRARTRPPPGRLLAITTGRDHLAELWRLVGAEKYESSFNRENGREQLERHFDHVERHDVHSTAVFAARGAVAVFVASEPTLWRRAS